MRIVVAGAGSRGDLQPMVLLADALRRRGHDVALCGPPNFQQWAARLGIPFTVGSTDIQEYFQKSTDMTSSQLKFLQRGLGLVHDEVQLQFDALEPLTEGADALVCGGVLFAGRSVASWRAIPYVPVAYAPSLLFSNENTPPIVPWSCLPGPINAALWLAADALLLAAMGRRFQRRRAALGLGRTWRPFPHFADGNILLAADAALAHVPANLAARTTITGAFVPDAEPDATLPDEVEAFVRAGAPPVYVGFGSMADPQPAQTTRILVEGIARAGVRALLHCGWAGLGEGTLPDNILRVDALPHPVLFPRMAAVVHHGGAGTTAAASRSGVPQVVVPHVADQFYFGPRVVQRGVAAAAIPRTRLTPDALARALRRCVEDGELKARAHVLAAELKPVNGLRTAVETVERIVTEHRRRDAREPERG